MDYPKGRRALLRIPSTEGRSVCLCWAPSKPKGPKGSTSGLFTKSLCSLLCAFEALTDPRLRANLHPQFPGCMAPQEQTSRRKVGVPLLSSGSKSELTELAALTLQGSVSAWSAQSHGALTRTECTRPRVYPIAGCLYTSLFITWAGCRGLGAGLRWRRRGDSAAAAEGQEPLIPFALDARCLSPSCR